MEHGSRKKKNDVNMVLTFPNIIYRFGWKLLLIILRAITTFVFENSTFLINNKISKQQINNNSEIIVKLSFSI